MPSQTSSEHDGCPASVLPPSPPEPPAPAEEPAAAPAPVAAAGAGSLSGRIVLDGDRPEVKALNIKSEQAAGCCADGESVDSTDRSLMVGASGGIANVVVTIEVDGATAPMPTEPIPFRADRPFFFLIQEGRTKAILFMGRFAQP